jgi:hypothetical protein
MKVIVMGAERSAKERVLHKPGSTPDDKVTDRIRDRRFEHQRDCGEIWRMIQNRYGTREMGHRGRPVLTSEDEKKRQDEEAREKPVDPE